MARHLSATKTENHEFPTPQAPQYEGPSLQPWPALTLARLTYPKLNIQDQCSWLIMEHTHVRKDYPAGHFIIRIDPHEQHGPSVHELLSRSFHLDRHKRLYGQRVITHQLTLLNDEKRPNEVGEQPMHLFLVDLRKAFLSLHVGIHGRNPDGGHYVIFDASNRAVDSFCERLRIR